jgi:hypothetical protein
MHGISYGQSSTRILLQQRWLIYFSAGLVSLLFSYLGSLRAALINPDAICYVESAAAMKLGLHTAMHWCGQAKWPFFSALIYAIAKITPLSYVNSAYLLDSGFSLISVFAFIAIANFIKPSARIMWMAAFVILLAHEFNAVREYIVRDHGFWAFYLVSILCLLHFFQRHAWRYALLWSASALLATLFRIEGLFFLLALPFLIFFTDNTSTKKVKSFIKLNAITILLVIMLGVWFLLHSNQTMEQLGRVGEVQFQLLHGFHVIAERFQQNAQVIAEHVLSNYAAQDARLIVVLVLCVWYCINVITNLSLINTILVFYAWKERVLPPKREIRLVLWGYVVINIVVTLAFLIEHMFLSKRYLLALTLTLLCWVPLALDKLYQQWAVRKWPILLAISLITLTSLGGIFDFGYSKRYIRDAGEWVEKHVPANAALYSNDYQVMFYSQHFGPELFTKHDEFYQPTILDDGKWRQYDYLAIKTNKKNQAKLDLLKKEWGNPLRVFTNKRGDNVAIYKIQQH